MEVRIIRLGEGGVSVAMDIGNASEGAAKPAEATKLSEISLTQWKSGIAAWLGWLFDGLDGTLYTLVAATFVAQLLQTGNKAVVGQYASYIQAAFLIGWAIGGAVFGRIGDRIGRSKTIMLTILTYALFTGLSAFAWNWQSLLVFRFLAALGIGGEWAAGSSLVSETWPRKWRPWVSAVLQSAFQGGYLLASLSLIVYTSIFKDEQAIRWIFLIGALPALATVWIRRNIPETDEWSDAQAKKKREPSVSDLFRGEVLITTLKTILFCSTALTVVWALIFWGPQHLKNLPDLKGWAPKDVNKYVGFATGIATLAAIGGNFVGAFVAKRKGYRWAGAVMFTGSLVCMTTAYAVPHNHTEMLFFLPLAHFFVQGIFGLFPLYIPPLFPTLLRTTGAGFCYNIGRLVAAAGTIFFGLLSKVGNYQSTLFWVGVLPVIGLLMSFAIPEPKSEADRQDRDTTSKYGE